MNDRDLMWVTDRGLQVTSLTAQLRDRVHIASTDTLHVSELWASADPFSIAVVAHRWALEGEGVEFEVMTVDGSYCITLEPMVSPDGTICGVVGRAREAGATECERLLAIAAVEERSGFGSWHVDLTSGRLSPSTGLNALLGLAPDDVVADIRTFDHPDDRDIIAQALREGEISGEGYACEHRILRADGVAREVRERAYTVYDATGTAIALAGSILDVTDEKSREAELERMALYDSLTKLPNRRLLEDRLDAAIARTEDTGAGCAVLFVDLDAFKVVNDAHGHYVGDELLVAVARRLTQNVRADDMVARLCGDEFVVVVRDVGVEGAVGCARALLRAFEEPFFPADRRISVRVSIGVATAPGAGMSAAELIQAADREMYAVKHNGGSGFKLAATEKDTQGRTDERPACSTSSADLPAYGILASA